jgi:translation initiation factor 6
MKLVAVRGNPLVGLYVRANEEFALVGVNEERFVQALKDELDVDVIVTTIAGSELVGALAAMNSRGVVVSEQILQKELERIEKCIEVKVVATPMTCFGNNLCINDYGGIAHPEMDEKIISEIEEFLDIEIVKGTVGGIKTIGMTAVVTNRGGLVNPNANEWELKKIEEAMDVEVMTGTVNFGNDMIGSSLVANSKGYVVGRDTTGFELGVVEEALFPR